MDDGYDTCPRCKWSGKLRKDGTMRKHRESVDMGHFTMAGGLPQQTHGDICKGSGEKPWDYTPPEGGYEVKTTEHGGARLVTGDEAAPAARHGETKTDDVNEPGFCGTCGATFTARVALDAHQRETGHEMDQPDHPLNKPR